MKKRSAIEIIDIVTSTIIERRDSLHDNETAMYSLVLKSENGRIEGRDLADFRATLPADQDPVAGAALAEAVDADTEHAVRDMDTTPRNTTPVDTSPVSHPREALGSHDRAGRHRGVRAERSAEPRAVGTRARRRHP